MLVLHQCQWSKLARYLETEPTADFSVAWMSHLVSTLTILQMALHTFDLQVMEL